MVYSGIFLFQLFNMKRLSYLLLLLCMLLVQACQPEVVLPGGIYGTALDKITGEPIRNAEVRLSPGSKTTIVGSNGTFEFINLDAGQYTVGIEAAGYEYNSKTVTVVSGENTTCDFHLEKVIIDQVVDITPSSLNFGTTQNQLSITITNKGAEETSWSLDLGSCQWLSANPISGQIGAGKTQAIIFSVDRSLLQKDETAVVTLSAFGNSYPINVSCAIVQNKGVMNVSPTVLSFGEDTNEMSFTIKNLGNANLNWYTQGLSASCLSLSENNGTLASGASKVIRVSLNRNLLTGDLSTSFIVSDGSTEQEIQVSATKKVLRPIMSVSPTVLDFGDSSTSKTFTISNSGTANLDWSLQDASNPCLTFSDYSGSVVPGGKQTVTITLNRAAMAANLNAVVKVSDGTNTQSITIKATYVYVEDYSSAIVESFDNRFKCDIISCKRNGSKVEFKFKLTSIGLGDVEVTIFGNQGNSNSTIIADNLGTQYAGSVLTLGTQSNSSYTNGYVKSPLLEYVPINGSATIPGVPSSATSLHIKLNVSVWSNGNYIANSDWIKISNLPIY